MPATPPTAASGATAARPFTGWHMLAIMVSFFAIVIAVNVGMARLAMGTFSGVVVRNSYDASQSFNTWLDEAARERALGWDAQAARDATGRVRVTIARDGATPLPAEAVLSGEARRPLGRPDDRAIAFIREADGAYLSTVALPAGRWRLRLRLVGGTVHGRAVAWRDEAAI